MAVPKKRISRTRRDKRRTHQKAPKVNFVYCPECNQPTMPHKICPSCGFYKDRVVVETEE